MNGKKMIFCAVMALVSLNIFPQSMTLDEAIALTATELGLRLRGNKIAVLNFSSQWQQLSAFVVDELNNAIVRGGSLTVVDRQQLDIVRKELNFQLSGEVSDESAQNMGQFVGTQSVLSGSFTKIGNTYRFRTRVIAVETGIVQYSNSLIIKKDSVLTSLIGTSGQNDANLAKFGKNLGYGFLNPIFGLGSFIQGDYAAGGLLSIAYAVSGTLIIIELAAFDYWTDGAGICGGIGLGIASTALLFGFIIPFVSSHYGGLAKVMDGFHMAIVPTADGGTDMSIMYSVKF